MQLDVVRWSFGRKKNIIREGDVKLKEEVKYSVKKKTEKFLKRTRTRR